MNIITTIIIPGLLIFFSHAFNELFSIVISPVLVIILSVNPSFFENIFHKKRKQVVREFNKENQENNNTGPPPEAI